MIMIARHDRLVLDGFLFLGHCFLLRDSGFILWLRILNLELVEPRIDQLILVNFFELHVDLLNLIGAQLMIFGLSNGGSVRAPASPAIVFEVLLGRLNWKDVAAKLSITVVS